MSTHTDHDVAELIRQDHRRVEALLGSVATDPARIRGELVRLLSTHSVAEEMVVYPMLLDHDDAGEAANHHAREQHDRIKHALLAVDKADPTEAGFLAQVRELERLVAEHVEDEERRLLPMLQAKVGTEELRSMAGRFETAKRAAPTRPHPNAPDSATGHLIAGAPTSLVDRARDALDPERP
jgi:hemerythrin superfamily protein